MTKPMLYGLLKLLLGKIRKKLKQKYLSITNATKLIGTTSTLQVTLTKKQLCMRGLLVFIALMIKKYYKFMEVTTSIKGD